MVVEMVPVKGGRWHIIPEIGSIYYLYTTYSPCLLGGYMLPTTFYGNQKQPLIKPRLALWDLGNLHFRLLDARNCKRRKRWGSREALDLLIYSHILRMGCTITTMKTDHHLRENIFWFTHFPSASKSRKSKFL